MSDRIWITWETQRRNRTLSALVNAKLFEFDLRLPRWRRYPVAIWKTLTCLKNEKPRVVFAQNPSIVLAYLAVIYACITGKKVVIDAHNAGLFPAEGRHKLLNWIATRLFKWTTVTIVSNDVLKSYVEKNGGSAVSIPDPVPVIESPKKKPRLSGDFNVLFICSWAADEPYTEVLNAAARLGQDIFIYMTGNSTRSGRTPDTTIPGNVVLTGYVTDEQFNELLYGCDAVMVLTTRENCMLCGAYEGVAAGKPLLLSDTRVLRNYFSRGAVYVENNADSIANAVIAARARHTELGGEIAALRDMRRNEYPELIDNFERQLAR